MSSDHVSGRVLSCCMVGFGIDAEEYIAAVRAGAIDPQGASFGLVGPHKA